MGYIQQFMQALLENSESRDYIEAIAEWVVPGEQYHEPGYCICGHPIMRNFVVYHKTTKRTMIIGSCCIKKFGVERAHFNRSKRDYLVYAYRRTRSEGERLFVKTLGQKNNEYERLLLSEKQKVWIESITGQPYRWKCE